MGCCSQDFFGPAARATAGRLDSGGSGLSPARLFQPIANEKRDSFAVYIGAVATLRAGRSRLRAGLAQRCRGAQRAPAAPQSGGRGHAHELPRDGFKSL